MGLMGIMRGYYDEKDITFDILVNYIPPKRKFLPFFGGDIAAPFFGVGFGVRSYNIGEHIDKKDDGLTLSGGLGFIGPRTYGIRALLAFYYTYKFSSKINYTHGLRVLFGASLPTMGPDGKIKTSQEFAISASLLSFFITGLTYFIFR